MCEYRVGVGVDLINELLDWYILKYTQRVVSGLIHTQEYRESCLWIGTDLKEL